MTAIFSLENSTATENIPFNDFIDFCDLTFFSLILYRRDKQSATETARRPRYGDRNIYLGG